MSIALRPAKCLSRSSSCAGHDAFGQRRSTSPSGFTAGVPQTGQRSGGDQGRAPFGLFSSTTRTTLGITSPPRSMRTVSPTRTSLRAISSSLWRVARLTVAPASATGARWATGVSLPVRPTCTSIASTVVAACIAGYL